MRGGDERNWYVVGRGRRFRISENSVQTCNEETQNAYLGRTLEQSQQMVLRVNILIEAKQRRALIGAQAQMCQQRWQQLWRLPGQNSKRIGVEVGAAHADEIGTLPIRRRANNRAARKSLLNKRPVNLVEPRAVSSNSYHALEPLGECFCHCRCEAYTERFAPLPSAIECQNRQPAPLHCLPGVRVQLSGDGSALPQIMPNISLIAPLVLRTMAEEENGCLMRSAFDGVPMR